MIGLNPGLILFRDKHFQGNNLFRIYHAKTEITTFKKVNSLMGDEFWKKMQHPNYEYISFQLVLPSVNSRANYRFWPLH